MAFVFEFASKNLSNGHVDSGAPTPKWKLARSWRGQCRLGYQNRLSPRSGATWILCKCRSEVKRIMEMLTRGLCITWIGPYRAASLEIRRSGLRTVFHKVSDEGVWFGQNAR